MRHHPGASAQRHPPGLQYRWRRLSSLYIGAALVGGVVLASALAPVFIGYGATERVGELLASPSLAHPFGTDVNSMDVLARTFHAGRYDLGVATAGALLAMTIGVAVGATAGFVGGIIDEIITRVVEGIQAFPPLVLALGLVAAVGGSTPVLIGVIAVVQSVYYVRVMRAQVLSIRERDYVRAARAIGLPRWRIITWHVVPNGIGPIIVQMSLNIGVAVLLISALSFIGLGAPPPTPEWGAMIASGLKVTVTGEWWVWAFPGAMLFATVVAFNILGDGLRDVLDPTTR